MSPNITKVANIAKVDSRCFCWFPAAAILVYQNCTPIWRLRTKFNKGAWNLLANNSETVGHKDLRLGQIFYILVAYNIHFLGLFHWTVSNFWAVFIAWNRYRIYDQSRLLKVVTIPRVWLSQVYKNTWEDLELIGTTIEKPGYWMSYQFQKLCKHKSKKYWPASEKRAQIWTTPQYHERSSFTEHR